jgi:hypothetical protein
MWLREKIKRKRECLRALKSFLLVCFKEKGVARLEDTQNPCYLLPMREKGERSFLFIHK